jgi:hypothetical protein
MLGPVEGVAREQERITRRSRVREKEHRERNGPRCDLHHERATVKGRSRVRQLEHADDDADECGVVWPDRRRRCHGKPDQGASAARTSSLTRVTVRAVGAVRGVVHARQVPDRGQQVLRRSAHRNGRLESCVLRLDRCRSQVGHVPTARDAPSRALPFTNVPHIAHHRRACSRRTCHEANRHSRCEIRAPRRPIGRDMKDVSPKSDLARAALDRYLRDHAG